MLELVAFILAVVVGVEVNRLNRRIKDLEYLVFILQVAMKEKENGR